MELVLHKDDANKEKIEVSARTFACDFNEHLIHQVVVSCNANLRSGTKAQKTRAEVRGGGKKPWRQKGLGRARAGTICSPIWRTGGVTFAAKPRDHSQKVNKKMYRKAMQSIFSELVRQDRLVIVEDFSLDKPKTKELLNKLSTLGLNDSRTLIILEKWDTNVYLSSRNVPGVNLSLVDGIEPVSLIKADSIVITASAVRQLEELLG